MEQERLKIGTYCDITRHEEKIESLITGSVAEILKSRLFYRTTTFRVCLPPGMMYMPGCFGLAPTGWPEML